jgi:hypothetical protein
MHAHIPKSRPASQLLQIVILVVALGGILIGLLMPAVQSGPGAGRAQCSNNLKQIGLALANYYDDYHALPPAYVADRHGRPMHSWRALLLPYFGGALARQYNFDEPWDGPHNRTLIGQMPDALRCPNDKDAPAGTTNYVAVTGERTAWPYDKSRTHQEFSDGLSHTAVVVEVTGLNIPWTDPRDLDFDLLDFTVGSETTYGVKGNHHGGASVLLGDGAVAYLPPTSPPDLLRSLLTIAGGETVRMP